MRLMNAKLILSVLLILQSCQVFASSYEDLRVEGIMYDDTNQDNSVAVVDGNFLKKGDSYGGFKILSVEQNALRLVDTQTGKESRMEVKGTGLPAILPDLKSLFSGSELKTAGSDSQKSDSDPLSRIKNFLDKITHGGKASPGQSSMESSRKGARPEQIANPLLKFFGLFWELRAIFDVRTVYLATSAYYLKTGAHAQSLQDLISGKFLSKTFEDSLNGQYRFQMLASSDHIEVHADPIESELGFKHFYIDDDGTIRVEKGKPASDESPAVTPFNVIG